MNKNARWGRKYKKNGETHQTKVGDCNKHQSIFLSPSFFVCSIHVTQKKARKLDYYTCSTGVFIFHRPQALCFL